MNKSIVKNRIQRANRQMQIENMQRQALGGWDANYHLVSDFTNADTSNKWREMAETLCAIASFVLVMVAVAVFYRMI